MNVSNIGQRIEIAFWSSLIALMKETPHLKIEQLQESRLFQKLSHLVSLVQVCLLGLTGLVLGFAIGYVARFVW
jgi:hypothetical protein